MPETTTVWKNKDSQAPKIDVGVEQGALKDISDHLGRMLADTYMLYLKTHDYHWNVTGPMFRDLHLLFEEQYQEIWAAVDVIAERIRIIGEKAPGTYHEMSELTSIKERGTEVPNAEAMVADLVKDHQTVIKTCRNVLKVAENADDQSTMDLAVGRIRTHEKQAWMLRSLLQ